MPPKVAVFVIGPPRSGKTFLANHLGEVSETFNTSSASSSYRPTQGVRILELERRISGNDVKRKSDAMAVQVELWDCSGNSKFYQAWPTLAPAARAVILMVGDDTKGEEMEAWNNFFSHVPSTQKLVVHLTDSSSKAKLRLGPTVSSLSIISTTWDSLETISKEFDRLLAEAVKSGDAEKEREERSIAG
ncbi:hypothetical protein BC832DRAFT_552782 [Gaertneriomyces semiglobifer]|nr:hypothetical protein BC832DRAFT_552782 [Gaertneriomyces semiglobifer]